ncbi:MAG TPA: TraB/GumN family protein, partial [Flavisolibacter sp.]|nr:TraB/GumN family protein [Flavisolibacter sp.]
MKKLLSLSICAFTVLFSFGQSKKATSSNNNTLLWRITGKNITKPSYLFGTMHMLCADDIVLSDSLRNAISKADDVYLELDMDNMFEMMGAMTKMKMRG